jgi:ankyrin repeat protein
MSINSVKLAEVIKKYRLYPNFLGIEIVDVNQPGSIDDTMLHIAAWKGELLDVEVLIACGANVNAIGDIGNTPLHGAAGKGHLAVAKVLLNNGADRTIKNEFGETATDWALNAKHDDMVRLLKTFHP